MTSAVASDHDSTLDAATLEYLGLSADPFEPSCTPLFDGGGREHILAELLDKGSFSGQLRVIVGEEGTGKTSLLTAFCEQLASGDRAAVINVPILSDVFSILSTIEQRLDLPKPLDPADLDARLSVLRRSVQRDDDPGSHPLLIFDDAHHLDRDSLALVVQFASGAAPAAHLQVLLFGEPKLISQLAQLNPAPGTMQTLVLEPLSPDNLEAYLRFRLEAAGFSGIFPFGSDDIDYLWSLSAGIPGALHGPARQLLSALAAPPPESESFGLPVAHMSVVTILVGVLLIALFGRNLWFENDPSSERAVLQTEPIDSVAIPAGADPALPPEISRSDNAVGADETAGKNELAALPSRGEMEPSRSKPSQARGIPAQDHPLLSRPPERFALQVMALGSAEAATQFVDSQPNAPEVSVIRAQRQGKILHIIIVGDYATEAEARAAISRLPPDQRRAGPWPRSVASIHADIRSSEDD
ncbi:AAA family ATPase [Proteobacteria bacterium 005FR1]|nr:AAA family ATPase [Proteobacteria bacterium 005FR1]